MHLKTYSALQWRKCNQFDNVGLCFGGHDRHGELGHFTIVVKHFSLHASCLIDVVDQYCDGDDEQVVGWELWGKIRVPVGIQRCRHVCIDGNRCWWWDYRIDCVYSYLITVTAVNMRIVTVMIRKWFVGSMGRRLKGSQECLSSMPTTTDIKL